LIKANVEGDFPTGIDGEFRDRPFFLDRFVLHQNYPNPFNASTKIGFHIPRRADTSLRIYNLLGQEVQTLIEGRLDAGEHAVYFDGKDLASGIYFYRLSVAGRTLTGKCELLK